MTSRPVRRRNVLLLAVVALVQRTLTVDPASADLLGFDVSVLGNILAQSIQTVSTLGDMLTSLQRQLDALTTMLSRLDPQSFQELVQVLENNELSYDQLTGDVTAMGHTLMNVNAEFQKVYASNYQNVPFDRFDGLYARWQQEILGSAQVAARSQTTLSTLRNNATEARAILSRSALARGEVGQLQAVVQMLGLVESQNNAALQSLTTTGRVLASAAAMSASERQLSRETKQRYLANYKNRGAPVPDVNKLP